MNRSNDRWEDVETLDVRALFLRILNRRWWVVGSIVFFTCAFTAAAFLMTPIYRATVVMVPAAQERGQGGLGAALGQLGGLASLAGINIGSEGMETEEALAVLRSRAFGEQFIVDRNLIPQFFAKDWDPSRQGWKVDEKKRPTPGKAFKYFDRKIRSLSQDKKTGLVSLQIEWRDRAEAAEWANALVARLNSEMRDRAIARANAHLNFLGDELKSVTNVEMREAIGRLLEVQLKQRMLANVSQEYAFRVIDKAMVSDADDPVRPKKAVLVGIGLLLGIAAGVGAALLVPGNTDSRTKAALRVGNA